MSNPKTVPTSMRRLARKMWRHAQVGGYYYDGRNSQTPYFINAKRLHRPTGTLLIFTRDQGHHTSGWFKNPQYERCYHLSISFWDLMGEDARPRPFETKLASQWVLAFFHQWARYIWQESDSNRQISPAEVRHFRVFCDEAWQPIIPQGEVYSKLWTPAGYQTWSEQQNVNPKDRNEDGNLYD